MNVVLSLLLYIQSYMYVYITYHNHYMYSNCIHCSDHNQCSNIIIIIMHIIIIYIQKGSDPRNEVVH